VTASAAGLTVVAKMSGGDPGYGDTAKMLAEAGLCLALDGNLPPAAGVITPAAAMGETLFPRLVRAGLRMELR
ncbi:MAG: Saccharopine dehydrogenase L-glutamate-forming, partial [Moraxellaceae bacterium]|nr:Saccharopine dehydrogenase L-glutamate-forming [Moraxellaceae bacterium]